MDMEHFAISGRHYLCISNSFENVLSSSETTSDIYIWEPGAMGEVRDDSPLTGGVREGQFVLHQAIKTHGARKAKHFLKDGRHMLIIANNFDANAARYQTQVRTRWHM